MKYRRPDTGAIVEVLNGLGGVWIVGTLTPSGGRRRLKSPALPPRPDRDACERDLAAYAARKGWPPLCGTCGRRPATAREDNGLAAGAHCDSCWTEMLRRCKRRSW